MKTPTTKSPTTTQAFEDYARQALDAALKELDLKTRRSLLARLLRDIADMLEHD